MSWNILVTAKCFMETGQSALERLRQSGCSIHVSAMGEPLGEDELLKLLPGHDAVVAGGDRYSAAVLAAPGLSRLKMISRWGVGYDAVDIPAATANGIAVAYTPGLLNEAVADYTFALLLGIARRIHAGDASVRKGEWKIHYGHDIAGKTLGIIGYGRIGQAVGRRARGFDMRILAFDIHPPSAHEDVTFAPLDQLLAESDYVVLHAAMTPESRGLIGAAQLRKMKPSAYLINTARGGLVQEAALVRGLNDGWLAGAALDVFETEPLPRASPLRQAPNLLLSPHQASFGRETAERVSQAVAQAILDLKNGVKPEHLVNPEVMDSPSLRASGNPPD